MQVTIFGACHILAMSSACTNPVLYGFLNHNMKNVSSFHLIWIDIITLLLRLWCSGNNRTIDLILIFSQIWLSILFSSASLLKFLLLSSFPKYNSPTLMKYRKSIKEAFLINKIASGRKGGRKTIGWSVAKITRANVQMS